MSGKQQLDHDVVERVKLNVEGLNINQWAHEIGVAYRTIQKLVFGLTYQDVGPPLGPNWETLLSRRQTPGPKVLHPATRRERTPLPSNLRGNEAEIRRLYDGMLDRLAERYQCKRHEILRCLAQTAPDGHRLGRAAKFNPTEVTMIREHYRQGQSYAEIGRHWGVTRTTIARILGRGQYDENSYTPRVDTSEVTDA